MKMTKRRGRRPELSVEARFSSLSELVSNDEALDELVDVYVAFGFAPEGFSEEAQAALREEAAADYFTYHLAAFDAELKRRVGKLGKLLGPVIDILGHGFNRAYLAHRLNHSRGNDGGDASELLSRLVADLGTIQALVADLGPQHGRPKAARDIEELVRRLARYWTKKLGEPFGRGKRKRDKDYPPSEFVCAVVRVIDPKRAQLRGFEGEVERAIKAVVAENRRSSPG